MIVNLRGANGSGKSYLVGRLMARCKDVTSVGDRGGSKARPTHYLMTLPGGATLGLVGSYETACGGCDGIHLYQQIWPLVLHVRAQANHVLFEGMAVSSSYGTIGAASEVLGDEIVFAFLNTPLDVCVRNVLTRRAARGRTDGEDFDPYNVIKKWRDVQRSYPVFVGKGRRVLVLDHRAALPRLLGLLVSGYAVVATQPDPPTFPTAVPPMPRKRAKEGKVTNQ